MSVGVLVVAEASHSREIAAAVTAAGATPLSAVELASTAPLAVWAKEQEPTAAELPKDVDLVVMCRQPSLAKMVERIRRSQANHMLSCDAAGIEALTVTLKKLISGDLFGLEKYGKATEAIQLQRLRSHEDRLRALETIETFAEAAGVRRSVRQSIVQATEELLMNALYDAPVDDSGQMIYADVPAKQRLTMLSPRPVSLRYAAHQDGFSIAVRDRFGRLDKATVLKILDKCLHKNDQVDRKTYGAGLGLYLTASTATDLVFNVARGVASEVICCFDRVPTRLRTLSFFSHRESDA